VRGFASRAAATPKCTAPDANNSGEGVHRPAAPLSWFM
jgi:hypothetical protein